MQNSLFPDDDIDLAGVAGLAPSDTLVLTVNNRLARRLTLDLAQRAQVDRHVSELPRIMPLSAWLADCAQTLTFLSGPSSKFRLSTFASQRLWVHTIEAEEAERALMDVNQAARLAMDADILMDEWALSVPEAAATEEYLGFQRWRHRYHARLRQLDAEDANSGYAHVLEALQARRIEAPSHVVLAGFAEVSPRFAQLREVLQANGVEVLNLTEEVGTLVTPMRHEAADPAGEWRAAVRWARDCLQADASKRYAIVSSQLEAEAPFARRILDEVLGVGPQPYAYNVAVGRELEAWPAVHAALAWLDVVAAMSHAGRCPPALAGSALLAGHHAGARYAGALASADARWRRNGVLSVSASDFDKVLSVSPELVQGWHAACGVWRELDGPGHSADVWSRAIRDVLSLLGFPGNEATDSVTFQAVGAFSDLIDTYASLTPVARGLDGVHALGLLRQLARSTPFQPQRDPRARLDVLGMLEAEGGQWDGVWVLGLTDDVLPASPKPNPLIPLVVLRQASAPRATPARERLWAQAMFESLRRVAPILIVSHAHLDGERELRPSPLIAPFGLMAVEDAVGQVSAQAPAEVLELLDDNRGPPLLDGTIATGGVDVLDTQARNPMWAFVRHRLAGRAMQPYAEPASVNVRGQFLHHALEIAWCMLAGQEALHELMARGGLDAFLAECVGQAAQEHLGGYAPVLRELEQARACQVLARWFDLEARRVPFDIGEVEGKQVWQHGPLSLTVRLDRLDRLAEGVVIVDYKTGSAAQSYESDWSRVRPINLQLPFYASVLDPDETQPVVGLVLAQIHARKIVAAGLSDVDTGLADVRALIDSRYFAGLDWAALLARWRGAMENLAQEYADGQAVNVAWRASDLKYCDALPFLRLNLDDDDE